MSSPNAGRGRGADRLILWLSLAGMILAIHLWVQKARGFDQGCLGLDTHASAPAESGCREVGALPASHLGGVSNAAWGYAFYFVMALVSFGKLLLKPTGARWLHAFGEGATAGAFLYSVYLVYQMGFVAHAWCVLCLASAALVTVLFWLHVAMRIQGGFVPISDEKRGLELGMGGGALFAAMGVLVGVVLFIDRLGTRPLDEGTTARQLEKAVGGILPMYIDGEKLREMRACHFDWGASMLPPGKFTGPTTPFVGKSDGPEVVVFYDPNCPHCKAHHDGFRRVMEKFKDRVRFTIVPRILWDQSTRQVEALKLSEESGKYFELWDAMFAHQQGPKKGLSVVQIADLFDQLGLETANLEARLEDQRKAVVAIRDAAKEIGVDQVPAVYINGKPVWSYNDTEDCIGSLIERVLARELTAVPPGKLR